MSFLPFLTPNRFPAICFNTISEQEADMVAEATAAAEEEEETGAEEEEALGNGEPTIRARFPSGIERNYCLCHWEIPGKISV